MGDVGYTVDFAGQYPSDLQTDHGPARARRPSAAAPTQVLNYGPPATWAYKTTEDFEPLTATAALSSVTERIGLVVTGSATLAHPYHLARQLLSLDHLSLGRAGWNLVTSFAAARRRQLQRARRRRPRQNGIGSPRRRSTW